MKATIEVVVTHKFKAEVRNHHDSERIRKQFHKHFEQEDSFGRPLYADGELCEPEVKVESSTTFVDLNW